MRPQRKELDCHTKAIVDALKRFTETGEGANVFITHNENTMRENIEKGRLFLAGKFPVLGSFLSGELSLGNKLDGSEKGLGFYIKYYTLTKFQTHGPNWMQGMRARFVILEDAMPAHVLSHGQHQELLAFVEHMNARNEA